MEGLSLNEKKSKEVVRFPCKRSLNYYLPKSKGNQAFPAIATPYEKLLLSAMFSLVKTAGKLKKKGNLE